MLNPHRVLKVEIRHGDSVRTIMLNSVYWAAYHALYTRIKSPPRIEMYQDELKKEVGFNNCLVCGKQILGRYQYCSRTHARNHREIKKGLENG